MRLILANSMRAMGGGERWLLESASGLAARGHEIGIAARTGSALARRARSAGHDVLELAMRGDGDCVSVMRLARWMRERRAELLNVNVQRAVRIGCAAAALAGVSSVVERRGLELTVRRSLINRAIYGHCLSHVVANCAAIADALLRDGAVDRQRLSVIPNGIDPDRVPSGGGDRVRDELGIPPESPLVAVIGRLVPDKRHAMALEAFAVLREALPTARMVVVGAGGLEGRLRAMSRELGLAESVIFAGHREDVPAVLDAAQALLVSSSREGMPHVILEAMVAGTPVVATRVAGIPEMIEDEKHGLLIPPGSAAAAAEGLRRVLENGELGRELATRAGQRVRQEFRLSEMTDRFEDLFSRLIAGRGPRVAADAEQREAAGRGGGQGLA